MRSDFKNRYISRAEFERIVIPKLKKGNWERILEIGCSTAIYKNIFKGNYIGLDLTDIEFPKRDENYSFVVGNGYSLPFKKQVFDFVLCNTVLEHVKYPERIIEEISWVLREGGEVFIGVPTPIAMPMQLYPKFRGYNFQEIDNLVKCYNLKIIDRDMWCGPFAALLSIAERIIIFLMQMKFLKKKEELSGNKYKRWSSPPRKSGLIIDLRGRIIDLISSLEVKLKLNRYVYFGIGVWCQKSGCEYK